MSKKSWTTAAPVAALLLATALLSAGPALADDSPWGANYFPNVVLTTQDGKQVHFWDDLMKDRKVLVNFIYTSCGASCPLETAKLVQVQEILGDRMGKDIFFYSLTLDPKHDTPAVLKAARGVASHATVTTELRSPVPAAVPAAKDGRPGGLQN